jgi:hypothetical protein
MPKYKGKLHLEDYVSEKGENSSGYTAVGAFGDQVGTEPRNLLGRQQYAYGGNRDGEHFAPFGPDFGMTEEEKARMYGPWPVMAKTRKR